MSLVEVDVNVWDAKVYGDTEANPDAVLGVTVYRDLDHSIFETVYLNQGEVYTMLRKKNEWVEDLWVGPDLFDEEFPDAPAWVKKFVHDKADEYRLEEK